MVAVCAIFEKEKYAFEEDLKKNATYASIISLLVMILGRYFVKSVKWVNVNKTK